MSVNIMLGSVLHSTTDTEQGYHRLCLTSEEAQMRPCFEEKFRFFSARFLREFCKQPETHSTLR